ANLAKAARQVANGSFGNGGQLCVSLSRIYVPNAVKAEFEREFVEVAQGLKVGRSNDFSFDIGTLTSAAQLARVERFLTDALAKGARLLTGGKQLAEVGPYFFEPTVLTDIPEAAEIYREEVFGPVISVYGYETVDDAINAANDSVYGLNAAVFGNEREAKKVAARLEAGSVNINEGYRATFASFDAPMGGFKQSGQGRRGGIGGLLRFTEARTVAVSKTYLGIGLPNNAKQWKKMAPLMDRLASVLRRLP
ncbi:MAG: aldehyde dehydrogenase family protein, partial [Micrococcales bacterium]